MVDHRRKGAPNAGSRQGPNRSRHGKSEAGRTEPGIVELKPKSAGPRGGKPKPGKSFAPKGKSAEAKPNPRAPQRESALPKPFRPRHQPDPSAPAFTAAPLPPAAPVLDESAADGERIAKALARAGVASRREVERYIAEGRVAVNGEVLTSPAVKIGVRDILTVDGAVVNDAEPTRLWRYHKPVGLLTTHSDPNGRPTVFENLPPGLPRVISVGRLDLNSEGLLLLTNDGALARALELPKAGWIRRYRVRAYGHTTQEKLDALKAGVTVEGVVYGPIDAKLDKVTRTESTGRTNAWITVAISEGKNREVRRVMESIGLKVNRLIRLAYGPFALATLPQGAAEEVGPRVIRELLSGFIAPQNLPKGDRTAGPILVQPGQSRRPLDRVGGVKAPVEPVAKPKKVYKAGWAKPGKAVKAAKPKPAAPPSGRAKRPPKKG